MIDAIQIDRFRGLLECRLSGFGPLNIFVGPNGCGKSSLLDALWLASSPRPMEAYRSILRTRHRGKLGARWSVWKAGIAGQSAVQLWSSWGNRTVSIAVTEGLTDVVVDNTNRWRLSGDEVQHHSGSDYVPLGELRAVYFVDSDRSDEESPLHRLHTDAVASGQWERALASISKILPGAIDVVQLSENDYPVMHIRYSDRSVPVELAGDGIHRLLRLALQLAVSKGVVLIEEPETHQHPAAIMQSAAAIWGAVEQGTQLFLSTHSLELIDAIVRNAPTEELAKLVLFRLRLKDGVLVSVRLPGDEVAFARSQVEDDLR